MKLPKAEQNIEQRQAATEALIMAAGRYYMPGSACYGYGR
jgi:hypothetical protein